MMLAEVMRLKQSITVSGSHGKTTTTSLIASILEISNLDPTILYTDKKTITSAVKIILERVDNRPHIFNLGHGVLVW